MAETTAILKRQTPSALGIMADRLGCDPLKLHETLANTVFKGANPHELMALVLVANQYGLNPITKQIYAFQAKGGGIVPVVSIDGWAAVVNGNPKYDGCEFEYAEDSSGVPASCTCIMHIVGRSHPVRVTEFHSECVRGTDPWRQMPRRMLRHKAFIQCARLAFGLSGIQDEDEARDSVISSAAVFVQEPAAPPTDNRAEFIAAAVARGASRISATAFANGIGGICPDHMIDVQAGRYDAAMGIATKQNAPQPAKHADPEQKPISMEIAESEKSPGSHNPRTINDSDVETFEKFSETMEMIAASENVAPETFDGSIGRWLLIIGAKGKEKKLAMSTLKLVAQAAADGKFDWAAGKLVK